MPSTRPYRSKRSALQLVRTLFLLIVGLIGSGFLFWKGLHIFRSSAEQTQEQAAQAAEQNTLQQEQNPILDASTGALLNDTISLYSTYDGQATGRASRTFNQGFATIDVLVYLPALDPSLTYEVWMLKDGLADVVLLGELAPRADGSWAATFIAGPATGIADPHDYTTMVIMQELRDGDTRPTGFKIAQGSWNR